MSAYIYPGDTIVMSTPAGTTEEQAARLKAALMEKLPGVKDVIVLPGCDVIGVLRPEPAQITYGSITT